MQNMQTSLTWTQTPMTGIHWEGSILWLQYNTGTTICQSSSTSAIHNSA